MERAGESDSINQSTGERTVPKDKYADTKYRWKKDNTKVYSTRLSKVSEQDIIDWLESHRPTNAYIKNLIIKDMTSNN